ncbi:MAG: hypothetical protein GX811_11545 [Lentisphaerae bacterium]|nr:hypothetical protein [Lentisphaerota bacterium]
MNKKLMVGAAEVNITPAIGTHLSGSLSPRSSTGIQDHLTAKALVLKSEEQTICYVILDLCLLPREYGDKGIAIAAVKTGIAPDNIVWATNHTHTGPYTSSLLGDNEPSINHEWLDSLPYKFAEAVEKALLNIRPASMSRARGYCFDVTHNRRIKFKDGREINRWLLDRGEEEVQSLGSAGPIDPEIGILCFDDEQGNPIAVWWSFALHTNRNFGSSFSADYPAVVASRIMERFGRPTISFFAPGTCGDLNPLCSSYREVGDKLANEIIYRLDNRKPISEPIRLGAMKTEMIVPWRNPDEVSEDRIATSQWDPGSQKKFREDLEYMKNQPEQFDKTVLQAWRIGDVGFVSLPGEAFVELGLRIKEKSPFPWTYPVELGGDYLGYLVTEQAWLAGGYESLIARLARPSVDGVNAMVDKTIEMLEKLWTENI